MRTNLEELSMVIISEAVERELEKARGMRAVLAEVFEETDKRKYTGGKYVFAALNLGTDYENFQELQRRLETIGFPRAERRGGLCVWMNRHEKRVRFDHSGGAMGTADYHKAAWLLKHEYPDYQVQWYGPLCTMLYTVMEISEFPNVTAKSEFLSEFEKKA